MFAHPSLLKSQFFILNFQSHDVGWYAIHIRDKFVGSADRRMLLIDVEFLLFVWQDNEKKKHKKHFSQATK